MIKQQNIYDYLSLQKKKVQQKYISDVKNNKNYMMLQQNNYKNNINVQKMKKTNEKQPMLPIISSMRNQQKPIKQILKDLKQKKALIQTRIKTQLQQKQIHQHQQIQNQIHFRQRVNTDVPYYINRQTYYNRTNNGNYSLDQIVYSSKIDEKEDQNIRQSSNITEVRKKNSILQPIVLQQKVQIQHPKSKKYVIKQIQQLFVAVPANPRQRTEQNIMQLKVYLMENNIFFAKIHNVIATCLLKLNRLMWLQKNQNLYKIGEERSAFYIILCGRMKIYDHDKNLKKICNPGQSIAQELLFSTKTKKVVKQSAKALSRCFLVEIKTQNYKKMSEQMIKYGYRTIFHQMESILKRNFITKNWIRGQKQRYAKNY